MKNQNKQTKNESTNVESTKTNIDNTYLKNQNVESKIESNQNAIDEKLTIESINKNATLRQTYIDKLLLQLSNESTTKIDKKTIRRFLRSLNHRNGLRNTKYSKSKTLFDFIK